MEAQNYSIRKALYKYSSTVERQRTILFEKREGYLENLSASEFFRERCPDTFRRLPLGGEPLDVLCRRIVLHFIDTNWSGHLADLAEIQEGIHLRRLAGQEPVVEFQRAAISLFSERLARIDEDAVNYFSALKVDALSIEDDGPGSETAVSHLDVSGQ